MSALSKLKYIFILCLKWFGGIFSRIFPHFLWFFLTFVTGFVFHIFWIYIMSHEDFSFQEIILSGNLLFFLMAIIASVFIDEVLFGTFLKTTNAKFRIAVVVLFIIFLFPSCAATLVRGKTILLQIQAGKSQAGEFEFILAINIVLLIGTLIYAIITRFLSNKVQNTR